MSHYGQCVCCKTSNRHQSTLIRLLTQPQTMTAICLRCRFARWTLDSRRVRMQDVAKCFSYFAQTPLGRLVAFNFLLTNWDEINKRYFVQLALFPCDLDIHVFFINIRFGVDAFLIRDVIQTTTSLVNTEFQLQQVCKS